MAIQVRRGLKKDFDPSKMLPGEWAVSIDSVTSNQIVWMCFAAGVCKRMGTYEDFQSMIAEATADIKAEYISEFDTILEEMKSLAEAVGTDKETVVSVKTEITDTYIPQMQKLLEDAQTATAESQTYASNAANSADESNEYAMFSKSYAVGGTGTRNGENTDNAKYYADEARKSAENAAEIAGGDFLTKTGDASNTTVSFTKASTRSNIISGEKQSTIFGKIMKWFADLTAPAFAQVITSYADMMSNTVDGYLLDALAVKEGFETVNSNLSTKAEKRQYVTSVVGIEKITLDTSAYKVECMVIPYPDAGTKTAVPITLDLGILSYAIGTGTYNLSYGGNSDYHFELTVTVTAHTKNISLKSVKWSNTDVTSTAKLVVATVS